MFKRLLIAIAATLLVACSPKFDWREVHDGQSPYSVLMPGKPSILSRDISLGKETVTMRMTAVEIDHTNFAVGAAKMSDATQAQLAIPIIKNALMHKISGQITHEKTTVGNSNGKVVFNDEFGAASQSAKVQGSPVRMIGRLVAQDNWVYQIVVVGPESEITKETVETFLTSFKPD